MAIDDVDSLYNAIDEANEVDATIEAIKIDLHSYLEGESEYDKTWYFKAKHAKNINIHKARRLKNQITKYRIVEAEKKRLLNIEARKYKITQVENEDRATLVAVKKRVIKLIGKEKMTEIMIEAGNEVRG